MSKYLYNGVELPDINEVWTDKETYPYACLSVVDAAKIAEPQYAGCLYGELHLTSDRFIRSSLSFSVEPCYCARWVIATGALASDSGVPDGQWVLDYEEYDEYGFTIDDYSLEGGNTWSNHDILNTDGTTYLAASDPIPVGGEPEKPTTFTPDPISMTLGWLVGRRIAAQRG